jgi:LysR family D-serine deaminase transcriptional activator
MKYFEISSVLSGLHCFACVGEHLSFAKAAHELFITPSAVSHRIKQLETQLGFALFHRFTRRIAFTSEGQRLFDALRFSLSSINEEIHQIRNQEMRGILVVACPPSFARIWLAPRLAHFNETYPGIALHLRCHNNLVDFETENIDLAVCYSEGLHPDLHTTPLMPEQITPVCTAAYADKHDLWDCPAALKNCLLLHDSSPWPNAQFFSEWSMWASLAGLEGMDFRSGYSFDRSELAVKGAREGYGIALGRVRLVGESLDTGELVAPFSQLWASPLSYYLVCPHERAESPRVEGFYRWIQSHAA